MPHHSDTIQEAHARSVSSSPGIAHAFRIVAAVAVAALLWISLRLPVPNLPELWLNLQRLGARGVVLGAVGALGVASLQAARWWFVTSPVLRINYRDALAAILVGNFFNIVLPARAGDALRVDDLSRRAGVSRATLFGTEIVDFITDKSGWLPAFVLLLCTGTPPSWLTRVVTGLIALLAGFALVGFALRRWLRSLAGRSEGWFGQLATGITANQPGRFAIAAFLVAAGPWLFETLGLRAVAGIGGIQLSLLQAFAVLTAFNVATVVPTPGGIGPNEAASIAALLSFGVPGNHALAFAVMYHATQLMPGLVVGGGLFLSRRAFARRVQNAELVTVNAP